MNPTERVTDGVLRTICGILEKTEGIGKSEEAFGEVLRKCALDLRDARAEVVRLTHEGCPSWMGYEKGCAEADAVEAGRVELERLRAEVERLRADLQEERTEKWKLCADQATEIKRLRAALEPFVVHYKRVEFWDTDKVASYCLGGNTFWIRLAELCEAAEAAAKGEGR